MTDGAMLTPTDVEHTTAPIFKSMIEHGDHSRNAVDINTANAVSQSAAALIMCIIKFADLAVANCRFYTRV